MTGLKFIFACWINGGWDALVSAFEGRIIAVGRFHPAATNTKSLLSCVIINR